MAIREKHRLLRASAVRLRERARVLDDTFTDPDTRSCVRWILEGLDDALAWLDGNGNGAPLPKADAFLAGTTSAIALLEDILRRHGRKRELRAMLASVPGLSRALDDVAGERAARRPLIG